MFAPGVPEVMDTFDTHSNILAAFVVSVYILGFAVGPLVVAPLSEMYGRLPLYLISNTMFVTFTIACAVSSSMGMLIGFRFLQGCFGAAPITIGGGTIADLMPVERRGGAIAIWAMGPLIGPVIGPIVGGFLTEAKGWRWIFWAIAMAAGAFCAIAFFVMRETYGPIILARKTTNLRKATGNTNLRSKFDTGEAPRDIFARSIIRPTKMLTRSPVVFAVSLYTSIVYGILYLLFTTFTFVFEGQYGFSSGIVGLTYLGVGIGSLAALLVLGTGSDKVIKYHQKKGHTIKPEHRIPMFLTLPGAISMPCGLFIYGWTTQYKVHWIVPLIGTVFIGYGLLTVVVSYCD